jgi:hypothetical protein
MVNPYIVTSETFKIPLPTVSINNFYYANKQHGIRAEAREWQYKFFNFLSLEENKIKLQSLRNAFDIKNHGYVVDFQFEVPKLKFINKTGGLSSRTIDLSNCEKSIIDVLFLPKHCENDAPYGCQNLCIDDKYLVGLSSRKRIAETYNIKIEIKIVDLAEYVDYE